MCDDAELLELSGYLKMKSCEDGLWYNRFVVLNEHIMKIYKDNSKENIEQTIILNPTVSVTLMNFATPKSPRFKITDSSNSKIHIFSTGTTQDASKWVVAINNSLDVSPILAMTNFEIISVIGRGSCGKVMLVQHKTNFNIYAIKAIPKDNLVKLKKSLRIIAEKNILLKTQHPFIVQLKFAFQTPAKFYIGLEYIPGGDLFHHMNLRGRIPIDEVRLYAAEISLALDYLHSIGIVYRDLKPENIMLDSEGHIKLTDFGLAKELLNDSQRTSTLCGTTEYLAPEIALGHPYDFKVDWWALGAVCYEMITESTPFASENRKTLLNNIIHKQVNFPSTKNSNNENNGDDDEDDEDGGVIDVPEDAVKFVSALLTKNPKMRPGLNELKSTDFFKNIDWDKVYKRQYTPAYVPTPKNMLIPSNFDQEYTHEPPVDSPVNVESQLFPGFSYQGSIPSSSSKVEPSCLFKE